MDAERRRDDASVAVSAEPEVEADAGLAFNSPASTASSSGSAQESTEMLCAFPAVRMVLLLSSLLLLLVLLSSLLLLLLSRLSSSGRGGHGPRSWMRVQR